MRSTRFIATAAATTAAVAFAGSGAVADAPVTGGKIADGTVSSRDLTAALNKTRKTDHRRIVALEAAVRALGGKLPQVGAQGAPGSNGSNGANGSAGSKGDAGTAGQKGADGAQGNAGAQGAPGRSAVESVNALSSDLDVTAPAWAKRENSCDPTGPTGTALLAYGHLVLSLPTGDGGNAAAAGVYNGLNGVRVKDIERIAYSERAEHGVDGYNAPYFRIYTEDYAHGIVYSPSTQPGGPGSSDGWRRHVVTDGTVRYDDDGGSNPDITWSQLVADHGNEVVSQVRVVAGCGGAYTEGSTAQVDDVTLTAAGESVRFDFGE